MKDVESQGKSLGFLRSALHSLQSNHHMRSISEEWLHLSLYDLSLEWPEADTLPYHNQLVDAPLWGSPLAPSTGVSVPSEVGTAASSQQECSRTTLVVDHGVVRLSISLSQMTLIILLIVQVPTTKGTLRPKSDSLGTTRNTVSLSYPAISNICMCKMTNPSGLESFPPMLGSYIDTHVRCMSCDNMI